MKTTIEPILERLKAIAPSVCFTVSREIDENFVWDGDGPDPIDEGFDACDVTVAAKAIVNGTEIEGCEYLGGSYFKPGEPCGDVQGYLPQMLAEAAEELETQLGERGLLNAELATQLHNAAATIQGEIISHPNQKQRTTMSKVKSPDISGMTMSQIQKLVDELNGKASATLPPIKPAKSGEWLWRVGATYLIRTMSYHYTGIFVGFNGPNNSEVVLKDAAWIADTGRFMQAVQDGTLGEVEPYPNDALVGINRTAIADFCEVKWPTPRSQK